MKPLAIAAIAALVLTTLATSTEARLPLGKPMPFLNCYENFEKVPERVVRKVSLTEIGGQFIAIDMELCNCHPRQLKVAKELYVTRPPAFDGQDPSEWTSESIKLNDRGVFSPMPEVREELHGKCGPSNKIYCIKGVRSVVVPWADADERPFEVILTDSHGKARHSVPFTKEPNRVYHKYAEHNIPKTQILTRFCPMRWDEYSNKWMPTGKADPREDAVEKAQELLASFRRS